MFTLQVELLSDTVFAGAGGSTPLNADTEPDVDPETGLPRLRGRTLKGLLFEELALIVNALEQRPAWVDAATRLFGTPGSYSDAAKLRFEDGGLDPALVKLVTHDRRSGHANWSKAQVLDALTVVRSQTKIDQGTGAAQIGSLRDTRLVRRGLTFHCPVHTRGELTSPEKALLAASVLALRRVGLHRNSGWGRVRCRLFDGAVDVGATWIEGLRASPGAAPLASNAAASACTPHAPAGTGNVIEYELVLDAPLVLSTQGGDANAVETLPYVSGSSILGALAGRWLAGKRIDAARDPQFRALFLDGSVRWLIAYPCTAGERSVPAPLCLVSPKSYAHPSALHDASEPDFDAGTRVWQPLRNPTVVSWTSGDAPSIQFRTADVEARFHHARDDREAGRSTGGAIFTYVALAAGERFRGAVLCDTQEQAAEVERLLRGGPLMLGRSRTASYGGAARVTMLSRDATASSWHEVANMDVEGAERVSLVLGSDYIGRSAAGASDPGVLLRELEEHLGLARGALSDQRRYLSTGVTGGHVAVWKMPRPTGPVVRAGSVVTLPANVDRAKLAALVWRGVGERRAEGFGRLWVLENRESWPCQRADRLGVDAVDAAQLSSAATTDFQRSLLRNELRRKTLEQARDLAQKATALPSPALLARVRTVVRRAASPEAIAEFLGSLSHTTPSGEFREKRAAKALRNMRIGGARFDEWLKRWAGAGWREKVDVAEVARNVNVSADLMAGSDEQWRLVQLSLDELLERLRRKARGEQRAATTAGASHE